MACVSYMTKGRRLTAPGPSLPYTWSKSASPSRLRWPSAKEDVSEPSAIDKLLEDILAPP
jgi:hypothetical protein